MDIVTVPAPETDRVIALTPKGQAIRRAYKLAHALRGLDAADRDSVLELLALEVAELPIA